jgi:hypothetical protein
MKQLPFFMQIPYRHADNMSLNEPKFNIHCLNLSSVRNHFPESQHAFSPRAETLAAQVCAAE